MAFPAGRPVDAADSGGLLFQSDGMEKPLSLRHFISSGHDFLDNRYLQCAAVLDGLSCVLVVLHKGSALPDSRDIGFCGV